MKMKELREQSGLTQPLVAKNSGIDVPTLSRIENGKVLPTPLVLRRICETLYQNPLDIYEQHEIDLINCMGNNKTVKDTIVKSKHLHQRYSLNAMRRLARC